MDKKNVAVLFGGCSPEYGVSLESASSVIRNLNLTKYEPILIGITREGDWYRYTGPVERIAEDTWYDPACCTPAAVSVSRSCPGILCAGRRIPIDIALPVLHGKNGEDGTVQGVFALAGIPVAGCGVLASALCMDKDRAHKLAALAGVRVPRAQVLRSPKDPVPDIGFPLFVKPVKAGSSFGITKVTEPEQLAPAIEKAFSYDDEVIVEENIPGFEVGCAVLGVDELTVGEVDEIELSQGFFDFTEKYTLKTSSIHVPARIPREKAEEIRQTAARLYRALGCSGFARVDMFLTPEGEIVFNEINTIPGFTEHSRYPTMMKCAGLSFAQVVERILDEARAE